MVSSEFKLFFLEEKRHQTQNVYMVVDFVLYPSFRTLTLFADIHMYIYFFEVPNRDAISSDDDDIGSVHPRAYTYTLRSKLIAKQQI